MLDVLVLSRPPSWRGRYFGAGSISTAAHCAVVVLALVATQHRSAVREALAFDTALVFVDPSRPAAPEKQPEEPQILLVDEPVKGFQTIVAVTDIPTELPSIDLTERFDPRDYSGVGVEGGTAEGREADVSPGTMAVFAAAVVEVKPEVLESAALEYPPLLRQAGLQGRAVLEFVVDQRGYVEAGTIRVVYASHPAFAAAARAGAPTMRFTPARVNERPVRVLVRVPFDFALLKR